MNHTTWVLAIDFGTTYTVAASRIGDRPPEVIEIDGERRVPSVILLDESGEIRVGRSAENLASTSGGRVLRAPKSRLGEPAPVVLGGRAHSISTLVAALLRYVYDAAVGYHGSEPAEVRLTHPATWSGPRRQQLIDAAELAGIDGPTLVPEPVAAAIAYADETAVDQGGQVLVYDLGGGTFDTAALQASPNGFIVMGRPGGDPRLGGELFDELLANSIGERLDPAVHERLQLAEDRLWAQAAVGLRREARRVKEALSTQSYAEAVLGLPDGLVEQRVEQEQLNSVIGPYITESVDVMQQTASGAGIGADDIASIYLVGGASRTPLVEELVREAYPSVAISRRGDPKGVVAMGATHPLATPTSLAQRSSLDRASTLDTPAPPPPAAPAAGAAAAAAAVAAPGDPETVVDASVPHDTAPDATVVDSATAVDAGTVIDTAQSPLTPSGGATSSSMPPPPSPAADGPSTRVKIGLGVGVVALLGLGSLGLTTLGGGDGGNAATTVAPVTTIAERTSGSTLIVPSTILPVAADTTTAVPATTVAPDTTAVPTTAAPPVTTAASATGPTEEEARAALVRSSDFNTPGWVDLADDDPIITAADEDGFCGPEPTIGLVSESTSAMQNANDNFRYLVHTIDTYDSVESADATFSGGFDVYANCAATTADLEGTIYDMTVIAQPFPEEDTADFACVDDTATIGFALTNEDAFVPAFSQILFAIRCGRNVSVVGYASVGTFDTVVDIDFAAASSFATLRLANLPGSKI